MSSSYTRKPTIQPIRGLAQRSRRWKGEQGVAAGRTENQVTFCRRREEHNREGENHWPSCQTWKFVYMDLHQEYDLLDSLVPWCDNLTSWTSSKSIQLQTNCWLLIDNCRWFYSAAAGVKSLEPESRSQLGQETCSGLESSSSLAHQRLKWPRSGRPGIRPQSSWQCLKVSVFLPPWQPQTALILVCCLSTVHAAGGKIPEVMWLLREGKGEFTESAPAASLCMCYIFCLCVCVQLLMTSDLDRRIPMKTPTVLNNKNPEYNHKFLLWHTHRHTHTKYTSDKQITLTQINIRGMNMCGCTCISRV